MEGGGGRAVDETEKWLQWLVYFTALLSIVKNFSKV